MTYTAVQNDLSLQKEKSAQEQFKARLKKFTRNRVSVLGLAAVTLVIVLAAFAPLIALHDPFAMDTADRLKGISAEHWFGTDNMGRDVFARALHGARTSLTVGFIAGLVLGFLGLVVGLYASTNKLAGNTLMHVCDDFKVIPSMFLAIMMMTVLGADIKNVVISLIVASIPNMARLARNQALVAEEQMYIEAMRCLGPSQKRILWAYIVPNILSPMIVQMTFVSASAIITEAALSFLGAEVSTPAPSQGNISKKGKDVIYTAWWMILFPGVFTASVVLELNLLGDGVRDLTDLKSD